MAIEPKVYREAMCCLGAAVNIVTTMSEAGPYGFTASAICSVTDDPATLLVCVNRGSGGSGIFGVGSAICVNSLSSDQSDLSAIFADRSKSSERFNYGNWTSLVTGAPVLDRAAVSFDGRVVQIVEVSTHNVIFCQVEAVRLGDASNALIYFQRQYHALSIVSTAL